MQINLGTSLSGLRQPIVAGETEVTAFSQYGNESEGRIPKIYPSEVLTFNSDVGDRKYTVRDRGTIKENDDSLVIQAKSDFLSFPEFAVLYAHWSQSGRPPAASTEFPGSSEITEAGAGVDAEQYYGTDYGSPDRFGESNFVNKLSFRVRLVSGNPLVHRLSFYHTNTNQPLRGRATSSSGTQTLENLTFPATTYTTVSYQIEDSMSQVYLEIELADLSGETVIEIDRIAIERV